ncbi:7TM diverse intracellular signaling domain-containing protein [Aliarcobacter vitoriensis]|uniref:sensor histidine kinase n=1 Tax=Aliarcobacter vitoriensis TaxID=2011099 RepID=UPI003AAD13E5
MSEEGFNKFLFLDYFIWGVILGGMFLLLILHILFFFTIKNKSFISYIIYIFIVWVYFFVNNGYLALLLENGIYNSILSHLSAYAIFLVYMTFLDEYMKFRQKRIYSYILKPMYAYYIFIAFSSWVIIFSPAIYKYDSIYFILTFVSMVILIVLTSIEIYKTRTIQTFYILLGGQISIFVGYILIFLSAFQKIPVTTDTQRIIGFFLFLEMILFTFAIFIRLKYIVDMKQKGEKLILSQSHFSSIGQMLKNIAHQWKVPTVRLGTLITEIESILFNNKIFDQKINNIIKSMRNNINFMESTIVEFTQFYSKDEKRTIFNPIEEIFNIKTMLTEKINLQNLEIKYNIDLINLQLNGNPKSFAHIVLILIENILDISKRDNISSPTLSIFYEENSYHTFIHFRDNCGGIKQKPIESIFELEVSSYQDKNRGIGLSIAKILTEEKLQGKLSVLNVENGAIFTLQIEKLSK